MSNKKASFGLTAATIQKIQNVFSQYPTLEYVTLYGSRAKGNYHQGSDIDLTFIGKNFSPENLYRIDDALDELLLPYTFDLSLLAEIDNPNLLKHIERVGVIFYKKG